MPQDVDSGRRHASGHQVPAEASVERPARDTLRPGGCLPERLVGCHRREILASIGKRGADGLVGGAGEFPPSSLAALAPIGVEDRLTLDAQVACPKADDLGPPSPGQNEGEQDRSVTPSGNGIGYDSEESSDLVCSVSPSHRLDGSRSFDGIAGIADEQTHPDEESVEGGQAGDPSAYCGP